MSHACQPDGDHLLLAEGLSGSSALHNNCAGHNVVHSPVVLEEEQCDEDGEEEGDGEVLVERPHCRPVQKEKERMY